MSKSFLQSAAWENFQISLGRKILWCSEKLVIKFPLPLGLSYLYCPRPDFDSEHSLNEFITEAKKLAKKENAVFLKLEPDLENNLTMKQFNNLTICPSFL